MKWVIGLILGVIAIWSGYFFNEPVFASAFAAVLAYVGGMIDAHYSNMEL